MRSTRVLDRPHIVLIMTDQHRLDTLAAYGDSQCHTPHLDALAQNSVIFDRHITACPLCVPTRTALATGYYPHHSGAMINTWIPEERPYGTLKPEYTTVYERLIDAGYDLAHIGVQHITSDPPLSDRCNGATFIGGAEHNAYLADHGFQADKLWDYRAPCPEFINGQMVSDYYTSAHAGRHPLPLEHFYDTFLADHAVRAIDTATDKGPLALACNFWAPHPPLAVPQPFDTLYDPDAIDLPANVGVRYEGQPACQLINLPGFMGATVDMDGWRRAWAAYLGLVTMVDQCIGRVIEALRRNGLWDDALVIFTADHGEMLGSHRMFQKMCMYDEAIRVPMFVKPPASQPGQAGTRRSQLTSHVDLAATICDYANITADPGDGQSIQPIVVQPDRSGRDAVFCEFNGNAGRSHFQRAVITETHKYIHNAGDRPELYEMGKDPLETQNLAGQPAHADTESHLRSQLAAWMAKTDDFLEISGPSA